jgi:hypothetical protein
MLRYALGLDLVLPNPEDPRPGGDTREDLLVRIGHYVGGENYGELRVILRFDVPIVCPHDINDGEMLVTVGPGLGGPLPKEKADAVIAEANAIGRSGEISDALATFVMRPALGAKRMLVLPPDFSSLKAMTAEGDPLSGVAYAAAREVKFFIAQANAPELAHLSELIDFCVRTRVVIAVTAEG